MVYLKEKQNYRSIVFLPCLHQEPNQKIEIKSAIPVTHLSSLPLAGCWLLPSGSWREALNQPTPANQFQSSLHPSTLGQFVLQLLRAEVPA